MDQLAMAAGGRLTARVHLWYTAAVVLGQSYIPAKEEAPMSEPFLAEQIILRAVSDPSFRTALATSPERTLRDAGFEVTRDQLDAIVQAKPAEWGKLTPEAIQTRIDKFAK
jgi:hypothetical protein